MKEEWTIIDKVLTRLFPPGDWSVQTGASGMNNTTRFLTAQGQRYVLRIYETHQDASKVKYEHSILLALQEVSLPFRIPKPVRSLEGDTILRLEDGKLAALFYFIEGINPSFDKLTQLQSFGRTTGQLTCALEKISLDLAPVYRPYYEIENTHPLCPPQAVIDFCTNPPPEFVEQGSALLFIGQQFSRFQEVVPKLKQLPHQLVHGDLNASNVLVDAEGMISAVLDFEFITRDLRVMELAVCLSDLITAVNEEDLLWAKVEAFLAGYGSVLKLTLDEINAIPYLVQLRRLDVFVHFLGRFWDGVDEVHIVKDQIDKTVSRAHLLNSKGENLIKVCKHYIAK